MKVKWKLLLQLLKKHGLTAGAFARDAEVEVSEVEKMLDSRSVGETTARRFIAYVGPIEAERLIDWAAMGKKNPYDCAADYLRKTKRGKSYGN